MVGNHGIHVHKTAWLFSTLLLEVNQIKYYILLRFSGCVFVRIVLLVFGSSTIRSNFVVLKNVLRSTTMWDASTTNILYVYVDIIPIKLLSLFEYNHCIYHDKKEEVIIGSHYNYGITC